MPMTHEQALEVIGAERGGRIVVTTMASVGVWPKFSDSPLDFHYLPSSMGQGPGLGLGLALAQPARGVIVLNGDGCTLMNLGCLVTLAASGANLCLVIVDNGLYQVTGGQPHAGSGRVAYHDLARAAGIANVSAFDVVEPWRHEAKSWLLRPGPVVVWLKVQGIFGQKTPAAPRAMAAQIERLQTALAVGPSR